MGIDRGQRKAHARAGRAGGAGWGSKAPTTLPPETEELVSRETDTEGGTDWVLQANDAFCSICRRTAHGLRVVLRVWEAAVQSEADDDIRNSVLAAINLLEGVKDPI